MNDQTGSEILDHVAEEGRRLATAAAADGLTLRLLGGVAVWVQCPSARDAPLARSYGDADFIGSSGDSKQIIAFLEGQGYEADKLFNALHGASRLNFSDPARNRPLDVLLDKFVMAHELDLRDSVGPGGLTIALADLLMTKLQVVSINEKDVRDIAALLLDHELGSGGIDSQRILDATHNDWGLEHTIHGSLATLGGLIAGFGLDDDRAALIRNRAQQLDEMLNGAPKGTRWKMRARIGERVKWYQEPEEARS